MFRLFLTRRALIVSLVLGVLGLFAFVVTTQAIAARRAWRWRSGYRAPATPKPAPPAPAQFQEDPYPLIPRPEPDPLTLYDGFPAEWAGPVCDEAHVRRELAEIHRRLRADPAFRIVPDDENEEVVITAAWNHERTSESAFQRALESLGSVETSTTIAALRGAARVLDARANDCEDSAAYDRADELRELARKLRQEARQAE